MTKSLAAIADILRDRVLRGIRAGTLAPGSRLPSARELVREFNVDNRLILSAYRQLAADGLVEIRERGGVYVQRHAKGEGDSTLPVKWFADTFAEALARGISSADLSECLRRLAETVRLRAIVISSTEDQVAGLARELRDDFGLNAEGLTAAMVSGSLHQAALRRADVFIATKAHGPVAAALAEKYGKTSIAIDVRPDLIVGEWALLLRQPVWAVVATAEFGELLQRFFAGVRGIENLRIMVLGRDDLADIPLGAPTYITHRVREALGATPIRERCCHPPERSGPIRPGRFLISSCGRIIAPTRPSVRRTSPGRNAPDRGAARVMPDRVPASPASAHMPAYLSTTIDPPSEDELSLISMAFAPNLAEGNLRVLLKHLNGLTAHRFTGVYRFEPGWVMSVALWDRAHEAIELGDNVRMKESYCWLTGLGDVSYVIEDACCDSRLDGHAAQSAVRSYVGVLLRDRRGARWGTLCHFDPEPRVVDPKTMRRLELFRPLVEEMLVNDHRNRWEPDA